MQNVSTINDFFLSYFNICTRQDMFLVGNAYVFPTRFIKYITYIPQGHAMGI